MHPPRAHKQALTGIRRRPFDSKYIREEEKRFFEELKPEDVEVVRLEGNLGVGFRFKQLPSQGRYK